MAKEEDRFLEGLTRGSPLLAEAAELITLTSLTPLGLPTTGLTVDDARAELTAAVGGQRLAARHEGVQLADVLSQQVNVIAQAAPNLAVAAPNFAVAAY